MIDDTKLEVEEGREVVRRTVVGGRAHQKSSRKRSVSVGIEKILVLAGRDPEFRNLLKADRERALAGRGIELSPTEAAVFRNLPTQRLLAMADGIDLKRHGKRRFLQSVAAAALAATTATASIGCDEADFNAAGGARPDIFGRDSDVATEVLGGSTDTVPVDVYDPGADEGIRPDIYDGAARGAMADVPDGAEVEE